MKKAEFINFLSVAIFGNLILSSVAKGFYAQLAHIILFIVCVALLIKVQWFTKDD